MYLGLREAVAHDQRWVGGVLGHRSGRRWLRRCCGDLESPLKVRGFGRATPAAGRQYIAANPGGGGRSCAPPRPRPLPTCRCIGGGCKGRASGAALPMVNAGTHSSSDEFITYNRRILGCSLSFQLLRSSRRRVLFQVIDEYFVCLFESRSSTRYTTGEYACIIFAGPTNLGACLAANLSSTDDNTRLRRLTRSLTWYRTSRRFLL